MKFDYIWLEDFLALAGTGNFTRAAEERHSSQPAFSRRIRALEKWIGAPLVDRSSQPARLTDVGAWFHVVAREMVAKAERLPGEARQVAEASTGTLRIASTHALSFTFLPRWLRTLESSVALGKVELTSDVLAHCEKQMQQGKVQFVLAHAHPRIPGSLDGSDYVSAAIGADRLVPVSKPGSSARPLHRLEKKARQRVPVLAYSEDSGMGRVVRSVLGKKLEALSPQVVFTADLASVLRSMALDGRGIAWLPRTLIEDDLAALRLLAVDEAAWSADMEIRLYRRREQLGPAAQAFWSAASRGCSARR